MKGDLPRGAGHFDDVDCSAEGRRLFLQGWFSPLGGGAFEEIHAFCDTQPVRLAEKCRRDDVQRALPWLAGAENSGFRLQVQVPDRVPSCEMHTLELVGYSRGQITGYLNTIFSESEAAARRPPLELVKRIGSPDLKVYAQQGFKILADLFHAIDGQIDFSTARVLTGAVGADESAGTC